MHAPQTAENLVCRVEHIHCDVNMKVHRRGAQASRRHNCRFEFATQKQWVLNRFAFRLQVEHIQADERSRRRDGAERLTSKADMIIEMLREFVHIILVNCRWSTFRQTRRSGLRIAPSG